LQKIKLMKKILFVLALAIAAFQTQAQKKNSDSKISFNVGGELALATGNLKDAYSIGLGATGQLEYQYDEKMRIIVNSGIIQYVGKKITNPIPNTPAIKIRNSAVIPVLGGVKYNFASNFYGVAEVGVSIFSGSSSLGSKFTYIPALGFSANDKIDILLKYTGYANAGGAFGVRVSYAL
jgi:hypothetical protein